MIKNNKDLQKRLVDDIVNGKILNVGILASYLNTFMTKKGNVSVKLLETINAANKLNINFSVIRDTHLSTEITKSVKPFIFKTCKDNSNLDLVIDDNDSRMILINVKRNIRSRSYHAYNQLLNQFVFDDIRYFSASDSDNMYILFMDSLRCILIPLTINNIKVLAKCTSKTLPIPIREDIFNGAKTIYLNLLKPRGIYVDWVRPISVQWLIESLDVCNSTNKKILKMFEDSYLRHEYSYFDEDDDDEIGLTYKINIYPHNAHEELYNGRPKPTKPEVTINKLIYNLMGLDN